MSISIRLREDFQLVHEPITGNADATIFYEEAEIALKLRERLQHSTGGTFLVTGFRGVGKTTAVHQALHQLAATGPRQVIDVTVPVARQTSTTALLFEVTRRLVERLSEMGVLDSLSAEVRDSLLTAYTRTSLAYSQTSTQSEEKTRTVGFGGSLSFGNPRLSIPLPRFSRTRKRAASKATEISFLAYSEADVEHDFLRIVALLRRDDAVRRGRLARLASRVGITAATRPLGARIVVVFDEIDKLTEADGGLEAFEAMFGGLKNILAAAGVHFVVVAGVDLHDEWLRESATANSLYRSVFAWQGYVGCSWEAARQLLDKAIPGDATDDKEILASYLGYRGRGIIRNVLYEFNELVEWDAEGPCVEIDGTAEERVRLLGELAGVLDGGVGKAGDSVLAAPSDKDRFKQITYFIVDWVLRAGNDVFTVEDVMDPGRDTALDLVLRPAPEIVHTVLTALARDGYLEMTVRNSEVATQGPEANPYPEQYHLSREMLERLAKIASSSPRGRAEFGRDDQLADPLDAGGDARKSLQAFIGDRYTVLERLGQGGFGTVWKGVDTKREKPVAIKVIRTPTPSARDRARREGEMLANLDIPGVIRLRALILTEDRTAIITDLVDGEDLSAVKRLPAPEAVGITIDLLRTLEDLHEQQIAHVDIKPSNIILVDGSRPVLIDLGTATGAADPRREEPLTTITGVSGTPVYMAPELFQGMTASSASDVWAVGILLLQLLTGKTPSLRTPAALKNRTAALPVSERLKKCLLRTFEIDPGKRPSAAELREELSQTPEAGDRGN